MTATDTSGSVRDRDHETTTHGATRGLSRRHLLVITDGGCEHDLQIARDHAFLMSPGMRLPFQTRKPVFNMA